MIRVIDTKKDRLRKLKPSTLTPAEPKIIWVKMINRLYQYDKTLMVRHKYNAALEDILAGKKNCFLIDLHLAVNNAALLTAPNNLNGDGMATYWKEFNDGIRLFEEKSITLMPETDGDRKSSSRNQSAKIQQYKLPPPPPAHNNKPSASRFKRDQHQSYQTEDDHRSIMQPRHKAHNIHFNKNFFKR